MNRQERLAWFNLIVVLVALGCWAALLIGTHFNWELAMSGFGVLGLLGLGGFRSLWYPRPPNHSGVVFDERDAQIHRQAVVFAYAVFWALFVLVSMGMWYGFSRVGAVPPFVLPYLVTGGFAVVTLLQALATIIQYRRPIV